ncbi:MAG: hypothetical protein PHR35_03375 [Kiritimatiellae bacterium]|nr:hypothetical protein [Kiritimatiellia bacterium]
MALIVLVGTAVGETLSTVGFLGNSGGAGAHLVSVDVATVGKGVSGVAVDRDRTLWIGAGTAVNRLTLTGGLIETIPLAPTGSMVVSSSFVILDDHLYFAGKTPDGRWALFGVAVHAEAKTPRVATPVVATLPVIVAGRPFLLAGQPLNGRVLMLNDREANFSIPDSERGRCLLDVFGWKPGTPAFERLCSVPGFAPNGVAVDPTSQRIYIGGLLPLGVNSNNVRWAITAVNKKGDVAGVEFPAARGQSQFGPVQYCAHVNVAGGALWDLAWYGFLARLSMSGEADPGGIEKWHHELGRMAQIVDVGDVDGKPSGLLACACGANSALYLGHWQSLARRVDWVRRLGCLPVMKSLWLTQKGWVAVGTESGELWWRFEDAADVPPRKAELHIAVTPTVQRGTQGLGLAMLYALDNPVKSLPRPMAFTWEPTPNNEARGLAEATPLKKPVGLTVENPALDGSGWMFVSDADTRKIWRTRIYRPGLNPDNMQWQPLAYADPALAARMETASDLAWLSDDTLMVAI